MSKIIEERDDEEGLRFTYQITNVFHSGKSDFQQVELVETVPFGKSLILDGYMQSSELDEHVFHECLVHPALIAHAEPKTVFIAGGGEGSTAREVLKHRTVEKCVMVDIDRDVVSFCRKHLHCNTSAFDDPRLEIVYDDARGQLANSSNKFDIIIGDVCDPLDGGPAYLLYTQSFYEMALSKLNPGGILVTQSGAAGIKSHQLVWTSINYTLRQVFPKVTAYSQAIYSFNDEWGFQIAFSNPCDGNLSDEDIDNRIKARIQGDLKFYDSVSHRGIFALSKLHRRSLKDEKSIFTDDSPVFMKFSH